MIAWIAAAALGLGSVEAGAAESFSFAVVGHLRGDGNGELLSYLDELIAELNRLEPDLVVLAGDIVWGDVNNADGTTDIEAVRADWERTDRALEALNARVLRVPGNHDINDIPTRDLWRERYGELQQSFDWKGCRFLLLATCWIPEDDDGRKHPREAIRGVQLDRDQVDFVASELERGGFRHAFVCAHHMLWWEDWAPWWEDVHPHLAEGGVRAVFAGDYGPRKFSHLRRDGIDYVQTSVENDVSLDMQRYRELSRQLSSQLDNFLLVTVSGDDVRLEVRTVAALTTAKFTPQRFREVNEYDKGTIQRRLYVKWGDPERLLRGSLMLAAGSAVGGFALGLVVLGIWSALRRRRRARGGSA